MLPRVRVSHNIFYLFRDRIGTLIKCKRTLMVFFIELFDDLVGKNLSKFHLATSNGRTLKDGECTVALLYCYLARTQQYTCTQTKKEQKINNLVPYYKVKKVN